MAIFKALKNSILLNQITSFECVHPVLGTDVATFLRRCSLVPRRNYSQAEGATDLGELAVPEPNTVLSRKCLKVAIVGRPNAGKSTFINKILQMNICDVSPKTHTTRRALKTAFTKGDTQIVFVDTPGLVTKKEFSRFELSDIFVNWKAQIFKDSDIIGIIHEVISKKDIFKLHMKLVQIINDIPESKPLFMILNKVDLVMDKDGLSEAITSVMKSTEGSEPDSKIPNVWHKFSKIFVVSALKNIGLEDVVNFLLEEAKPGNWIFRPWAVCNKPPHILVTDLLRAEVMGILPNEVPYKCRYEVEYMEENDLGEVICVALVKCERERHLKMLTDKKKRSLRKIAKKLESDLYKIIGKVFRLRIVAINVKKKAQNTKQ